MIAHWSVSTTGSIFLQMVCKTSSTVQKPSRELKSSNYKADMMVILLEATLRLCSDAVVRADSALLVVSFAGLLIAQGFDC